MAKGNKSPGISFFLYLLLFLGLVLLEVDSLPDQTLLPRQLWTAVFTLFTLAVFWKAVKKAVLPKWLLLAMGVFLLAQVLSLISIANLNEGLASLARYSAQLSFFLLSLALLQAEKLRPLDLSRAGSIAAALTALITAGQLLSSLGERTFFDDIYALTGTFSHKNLLSSALMLLLPFAGMSWARDKGTWRWLGIGATVLMVIEIFVLRTRGVWLGVIAGSAATLVLFFSLGRKEEKLNYRSLAILAGIAVIILTGLFSSPQIKAGFLNDSNIQKRLAFWDNSWQMIAEHPITGVGAGNWKLIFPKYGLDQLDESVMQGVTHIQRPHNDYLWLWSEAGPLALLAYLLIFGLALWKAIENLKTGENSHWRLVNYLSFFGLVAFLVFSFGDFPLERSPHMVLAFTLAALPFAGKLKQPMKLPLAGVIIGFLALFSLFITYQRWQGEAAMPAVLEANAQQNARQIIPAVEEALNPYYDVDAYANPLRYYSSLGYLAQRDTEKALATLVQAKEAAPYNILVYKNFGTAYAQGGQLDRAIAYLDTATDLAPRFKSALVLKAQVQLQQERYADALETLNMHPYLSQDRAYRSALATALRGTLRTFEQHGRFERMMKVLKKTEPLQTPDDYANAYRDELIRRQAAQQ